LTGGALSLALRDERPDRELGRDGLARTRDCHALAACDTVHDLAAVVAQLSDAHLGHQSPALAPSALAISS
jgi:hypothetical protein